MNAVARMIEYAAARHDISDDVRADAIRHLRDTLAVGIAGSSATGAAGVRHSMLLAGDAPQCRVLGTGWRLPAAGAAFCNSFQIHCLEWDAVHEAAVVHALSVVTGALLAISDRRGDVSETEFLAALCIGVDIASGIGQSSKSAMRFFRPATAGLLGAAMACARLEKMSAAQMQDVLGLAYSQVSGTMQAHVEGSIALPLQVAVAARAAITAVDLVKNGLTGPHDVLDGPFGFSNLIEPEFDMRNYLSGLGTHWQMSEISTKPFPTGRAGHGTLSTLQRLQKLHLFGAQDVVHIDVHLPPLAYRLVARPMLADMTPAYARLCLPFLGALMLRDGDIDARLFTPETFSNPVLLESAERIAISPDGNMDVNALTPQRLVLKLQDARMFDENIPAVLGSPTFPLSDDEMSAKFNACLSLGALDMDESVVAQLKTNPLAYCVTGHSL